jgi:hypothetical protein
MSLLAIVSVILALTMTTTLDIVIKNISQVSRVDLTYIGIIISILSVLGLIIHSVEYLSTPDEEKEI